MVGTSELYEKKAVSRTVKVLKTVKQGLSTKRNLESVYDYWYRQQGGNFPLAVTTRRRAASKWVLSFTT